MNISLFGLGYVGCVNVACLSKLGHKLVAIDIVQDKIDTLNSKIPTYLSNFLSRGNNNVLLSDRVNSFINNKWIDTTPMIVDKILSNAL